MRIAICDDDSNDLQAVHTALTQYDTAGNLKIAPFNKASDLFAANKKTPFDIAILDIEMKAPNGYEIAQKLVEQDSAPIIIFLTNSTAYAIRGYGIA
ncbi:MAG: response regulator, partial [Peptococcaceae bacterium]|nr:response regulator [Peptococcaceae bacterium]